MKTLFFISAILLLSGAVPVVAQPAKMSSPIAVPLSRTIGYGILPTVDLMFCDPSESALSACKGLPEMDSLVIHTAELNPLQARWEDFQAGRISPEAYEQYWKGGLHDTAYVSKKENLRTKVCIAVGMKGDKKYVWVDTDNDRDFGDETAASCDTSTFSTHLSWFNLPADSARKRFFAFYETCPAYQLTWEEWDPHQGKVVTKEGVFKVIFDPFNGDPVSSCYQVNLEWHECRSGSFLLNQKIYRVSAKAPCGFPFLPGKTAVAIAPEAVAQVPMDAVGAIGYPIPVNGIECTPASITPSGDTIFIDYKIIEKTEVGIEIGQTALPITGKTLDGADFDLAAQRGKYVLIDFWGTWCRPCVATIPELKAFWQEHRDKNLTLVSIASEESAEKVTRFVREREMDWLHLVVTPEDQREYSLSNPLHAYRITSYPTLILIGPDGKIIDKLSNSKETSAFLLKLEILLMK